MSRNSKIDPVEKVKIVEQYIMGEIGIREAGRQANVAYQSVQKWINIYDADGPSRLLNQSKNKSYSKGIEVQCCSCIIEKFLI